MTSPLQGIAPLARLGVIRAQGEEAAKFLHGQLTHDFALIRPDQARLAAFLTAKGRMLASFVAFGHGEGEVLLVCSRDLLAPALKRLSMFVLRAKVKLSDASADYAVYGLAGEAVDALPGGAQAPWSKRTVGDAAVVQLYPALGVARALWVAPATAPAPVGAALSEAVWDWGDAESGVATLSAPVVEAFVPQMLNYESLDGVNFKKGCYPGQEVVARSQFRGAIKRRAFVAHAQATPETLAAGTEIFAAGDAEQPVGVVVQSAAAPGGGSSAIVSLQTASAGEALHVGGADGAAITLAPLPYALRDDI